MNELLPVITAFLGAGLTFYFQKELINKQFEVNKKKLYLNKIENR